MCPFTFVTSGFAIEHATIKAYYSATIANPKKLRVFLKALDLLIMKRMEKANARIRDPTELRAEVVEINHQSRMILQQEEDILTVEA